MIKKIGAFCAALLGLSLVIIVHEFGHFVACKLFNVGVPVFSIGFGPTLFGTFIGSTFFQIAALPFGGYILPNQQNFATQTYVIKLIILMAGIISNIIFAYLILAYFKLRGINYQATIQNTIENTPNGLIGPIGIVSAIAHSALIGLNAYLLVLTFLNLSIAFFNILPLPISDGGQIVYYTIEAVVGKTPDLLTDYASSLFLICFIILTVLISARDIKRIWQ